MVPGFISLLTYVTHAISTIGINLGKLDVTWQRSFQEHNKRPSEEADGVLALSAFMLSTIQNPLSRKALVKEMWESGADTIVSNLDLSLKFQGDGYETTRLSLTITHRRALNA